MTDQSVCHVYTAGSNAEYYVVVEFDGVQDSKYGPFRKLKIAKRCWVDLMNAAQKALGRPANSIWTEENHRQW